MAKVSKKHKKPSLSLWFLDAVPHVFFFILFFRIQHEKLSLRNFFLRGNRLISEFSYFRPLIHGSSNMQIFVDFEFLKAEIWPYTITFDVELEKNGYFWFWVLGRNPIEVRLSPLWKERRCLYFLTGCHIFKPMEFSWKTTYPITIPKYQGLSIYKSWLLILLVVNFSTFFSTWILKSAKIN